MDQQTYKQNDRHTEQETARLLDLSRSAKSYGQTEHDLGPILLYVEAFNSNNGNIVVFNRPCVAGAVLQMAS